MAPPTEYPKLPLAPVLPLPALYFQPLPKLLSLGGRGRSRGSSLRGFARCHRSHFDQATRRAKWAVLNHHFISDRIADWFRRRSICVGHNQGARFATRISFLVGSPALRDFHEIRALRAVAGPGDKHM